jgi:ABC-2 type transport system ATP-binding protein
MRNLLKTLRHQTFVFNTEKSITELPNLAPFSGTLIDSNTFELRVENKWTLNEVFSVLTQRGLCIHGMRNKTNRLEELFLDLITHGH